MFKLIKLYFLRYLNVLQRFLPGPVKAQKKSSQESKCRQGHYGCLDPLCMQIRAGSQRAMAAAFLYCFTDKFLYRIIPRLFKFLW